MCNYVFPVAFVFAVVDPQSQYEYIRFNYNLCTLFLYNGVKTHVRKHFFFKNCQNFDRTVDNHCSQF